MNGKARDAVKGCLPAGYGQYPQLTATAAEPCELRFGAVKQALRGKP